MRKIGKQALAIIVIAVFAVTGCKKGAENSFDRLTMAGGVFNGPKEVIEGTISVNRTLSPGKVYELKGVVYVINGAKLTIEPGTVLTAGEAVNYKVSPGTTTINSIAGVLVITRGSSIHAVGTPENPIVFTSPKGPGERIAGDFGGVMILGQSTTNKPSTQLADGLPQYDGSGNPLGIDISYGGSIAADDSGELQYVRIEYAGYKLAEENAVNGLTLAGVGSGTSVDHVQVSYSADDAFEFFGGTVNSSYLLALGSADDDFDSTYGYTGHIQYAIGLKDPVSAHSAVNGVFDSNGIESDNDLMGTNTSPRTTPVYANFTLLGYSTAAQGISLRAGNRWRRNSNLSVTNSIIAGYNVGVEFQGGTEVTATFNGFTNNIVHAYTTVFSPGSAVSLAGSSNVVSTVSDPGAFLQLGYFNEDGNLSNPFYSTAVASEYTIDNLLPLNFSNQKGAVTYANYAEWTSGWLQFAPQFSMD